MKCTSNERKDCTLSELKTFTASKDTIKKVKTTLKMGGTLQILFLIRNLYLYKIYKELIQLKNKKTIILTGKGYKFISSKKIHKWSLST